MMMLPAAMRAKKKRVPAQACLQRRLMSKLNTNPFRDDQHGCKAWPGSTIMMAELLTATA
jgi:hypothetical protein